MEQFAREIAHLAQEIQRDLEDLRREPLGSNESIDSVSSAEAIERIERKLDLVREDTGELVERVPKDLGRMLTELKQSMLTRLETAAQSNGSIGSLSPGRKSVLNHSHQSIAAMVKSLTPQERHVFQLCFQSGFLTYREIADHLDITAGAAKNLVNRIFQSDEKRPLFAKQYTHGSARVGLRPGMKEGILSGGAGSKYRQKHPATVVDA